MMMCGGTLQFFHFGGHEGACGHITGTPETIHYTGKGEFMVSGKTMNLSALFRPEMLI